MRTSPLIAAFALLGGCSAVLGLHDPERAGDAQVDSAGDAPVADSGPDARGGYHATAVRFDPAGGDYLQTGTLAGSTGSAQGTFSVWLHFNGSDAKTQLIAAAQVLAAGGIERNSANRIELLLYTCNGSLLLDMQTAHTYTSASGWIHVLAAWDLSANKAQIYVNGLPDRAASATITSGAICYNAPKWAIGGLSSASLDADVADLYANFGTFMDIDVVANRARFRDSTGRPVDPGADCSTPNGMTPIACLTGPLASWSTNKGTGGGFTLEGDGLTAAPTSPSD